MGVRVDLDFQRKDGTTKRHHLEQAERATGESLIPEVDIPPAAQHVWSWFWALNDSRPDGLSGPGTLTYTEIAAWAALTGHIPRPWEVDAIKAMDRAYLASVAKISK